MTVLDLRTLLKEVGRRHVARVAVLYAAVAFGVLEAADIVVPALGWGEWAIKWTIGMALLGFPVTLILAWVYDLTPRGVVRTPSAADEEREQRGHRRRERPLLSAVLLLASGALLAAGALFTFQWSHAPDPAAPSGATRPAASEALSPLRIVVLPFQELGEEGDGGGSFADGIHEDILNHLMKIGSLEVISRTTALLYRNTDKPSTEIGAELNAGSILEGSVRRQGNRIRVVAQLIDARTDRHIWSETYDREETDIFRVQSDIAQSIAQALQAELRPEELQQIEVAMPVSGDAYEKYSEGIFQWDLRETRMNAFRAVDLFREATEIDPGFAMAWAALSQARMWLFWNFPGAQGQAEMAAEALDRAVELAPAAAETRLAQGYFYFYGRGDSQEALRYFREAEALKPSDANVIIAIGLILRGQDRWEEALAAFERARAFDYRSYNLIYTLADTYLRMRRFEDAERYLRLATTLAPEVMAAHRALLRARLLSSGQVRAGEAYVQELPRTTPPQIRSALEADLAYYRGDLAAALRFRPGSSQAEGAGPGGGQGGLGRGAEWQALLYHLSGREDLKLQYADSLRAASLATIEAATERRGPVQTGVIARAHAKLGVAYALLGESVRAVAEGSKAVSTLPLNLDAYEGADHLRDLVLIYTLIGATDLAIQELGTALSRPAPLTRTEVVLDPLFAPLRNRPEFAALEETVR